jgi:hypothetical protein
MLVFHNKIFFGIHSCGAGCKQYLFFFVKAALVKRLFRRMTIEVLDIIRRLPWATTKAHSLEHQKEEQPASCAVPVRGRVNGQRWTGRGGIGHAVFLIRLSCLIGRHARAPLSALLLVQILKRIAASAVSSRQFLLNGSLYKTHPSPCPTLLKLYPSIHSSWSITTTYLAT